MFLSPTIALHVQVLYWNSIADFTLSTVSLLYMYKCCIEMEFLAYHFPFYIGSTCTSVVLKFWCYSICRSSCRALHVQVLYWNGGKDSTACLLWAALHCIEMMLNGWQVENLTELYMYKCCIEIVYAAAVTVGFVGSTCTSVVLKLQSNLYLHKVDMGSTCTSVVLKF